jgi:hypothetical protein
MISNSVIEGICSIPTLRKLDFCRSGIKICFETKTKKIQKDIKTPK